jgi:NAD(P)-dependent dehydrogenase (short-subunit alcohol dehydrogenase family)
MDPRGAVAVITGASSGIGLATARRMAAAGAAVVLGARRAERLDEAVSGIRRAGGSAEAVVTDVTSERDVARLVSRTLDAFGRLDIMVCNAGFGYYGTLEETDPSIMHRMMDVNFHGTFLAARAALPHFRRQQRGHLVIVSSIVGRRGIASMSGYSATKAAQVGLAESLRTEFAGSAIHVSVVMPVSTETEFRDAMTRDFGYSARGLGPRQPADTVARSIVACIRRPVPEVYPYYPARALPILTAIAPGIVDRLVRRFGRRRDR